MKIFATIFLLLLSASLVCGQNPSNKLESKLGIAEIGKRGVCLTIPNAKLAIGSKVSLVLPNKPQKIMIASVRNKLFKSCTDNPDLTADGDFSYQLKISRGRLKSGDVAIALVNLKNAISVTRGIAFVDVNNDKKKDYFRSCTSQEGLWLSVWSGKPLGGKQIWNKYYYLGYDVVPSCKPKDSEN